MWIKILWCCNMGFDDLLVISIKYKIDGEQIKVVCYFSLIKNNVFNLMNKLFFFLMDK